MAADEFKGYRHVGRVVAGYHRGIVTETLL